MAYTTIDDPSAHFQTATYTGNGSSQSVVNDGNSDLQPDWLWIKERSSTSGHILKDTSRGVNNSINSHGTDAESANSNQVTSINSDGFSVGTDNGTNQSSVTMVAWQWKANGGTTSSNTDGSITSTVQANTTAGFSIITYTGNFDIMTIGHGLSQAPEALIIKNRDSGSTSWVIYHKGLNFPTDDLIYFNTNAANQHDPTFNNTAPSSSVITNGAYSFNNKNNESHVCYAFHSVKGYSKFGSYTGNGNADGPFVYTGFKPAWLMIKNVEQAGGQWFIHDNKRETFNPSDSSLFAESSQAETANNSALDIDFLSNGWKKRNTGSGANNDGIKYIYFAFAEHPFVSSKGVPVTAR